MIEFPKPVPIPNIFCHFPKSVADDMPSNIGLDGPCVQELPGNNFDVAMSAASHTRCVRVTGTVQPNWCAPNSLGRKDSELVTASISICVLARYTYGNDCGSQLANDDPRKRSLSVSQRCCSLNNVHQSFIRVGLGLSASRTRISRR